MKTSLAALLMLPTLALASTAYAAKPAETCATKQQEIKQQLEYAHQHNNKDQIAGLQKALNESQAHCTEADLQKDKQQKIAEKQEKVNERTRELKKVQAGGNKEKIAKQQKKLDEALHELNEVSTH
ncbi:DUF1090 domain-containing protein [Serratia sp. M24T3]|uniref:DUF1090 domain-containing protein n=1 Tax=Rouxiella sp. WC2420 TaxID=3234145 RepID=A0AB39VQH7_9GAMM|nr:DUF1090 domain-containing protein [Serratia sp. M24T3]EIC86635.1 hypothetical protein SPM24T3_01100 [Serratia sp. M24T3]